eukprot:CAMPEP_0179013744 /NCGR_PEP_ID=MMETSP0796-20121207/1889_1 /TAXON_ID=73915 /ORGANISM="Pyrodinium bahamense, Strain pbaha01" /LENGTH=526 /DNA_ID=CAMNT_0020709267 /DNA_START=1 /DNA_END=1578 /DNA_ORIENTATION=+
MACSDISSSSAVLVAEKEVVHVQGLPTLTLQKWLRRGKRGLGRCGVHLASLGGLSGQRAEQQAELCWWHLLQQAPSVPAGWSLLQRNRALLPGARAEPRVLCRLWEIGGDAEVGSVPVVLETAGAAVFVFFARVLWAMVQLGAAGVVLTRLLPWQAVEFPRPVSALLGVVYTVLSIYASLFLRAAEVVVAFVQSVLRGPPPLVPSAGAGPIAPTWDELDRAFEDLAYHEVTAPLPGVFNPSRTSLRLFDAVAEDEVRVVFWRDSAAWCPYCMKTQLFLEECRIPYRTEFVNMSCYGDKRAEFLRLSPAGLLPVAEIDGEVVRDSDRIISRLRRMPEAARSGMESTARKLRRGEEVRLIDVAYELQAVWLAWLRSPVNDAACERAVADQLDVLEAALARSHDEGPFTMGRFSVVECHLAPVLERMVASLAYYKGFFVRSPSPPGLEQTLPPGRSDPAGRWPHIQRWFEAMESRPSYRSLAGDFYTHAHDLPPQLGACARNGKGLECEAHVDGHGGSGAWLLPLPAVD